jgi:predicted molibdopterin-dependent oxidoreductase YjgC
MAMIRLSINGRQIESEEGKTILQAARENGIYIPTLCYHENLLPIGSCRLCIVEVEGYANPVASCVTAAVDGLVIKTDTEKLLRMRQDYLKFLLIHHPLDCPICDAGGECQLQDLVFEHKIEKVDLRATRSGNRQGFPSSPLLRYFVDRCVLCLRCVHACREVSGRDVLDLTGNGIDAKMTAARSADCISCGECLSVCPVGSITENLSPVKSRFWQVARTRTTCPHCGFGCTFDLDVFEDRYVTNVVTEAGCVPNNGSLCVLGRFGYDFVNHEARLASASVRSNGASKECGTSEAVQLASDNLSRLANAGKSVGFLVSSRTTNEEIYLVREIAGRLKKSFVASSAACHTGRALGLMREMGLPSTREYDDLKKCDLIIVVGANLLSNNHVLANKVREAFKLTGSRVIVVDPGPNGIAKIADVHLAVQPGHDGLLFNTLSARLVEEQKFAPEAGLVEGFAGFSSNIARWKAASAGLAVGVPDERLEKAYRLITKATSVGIIFGSGVGTCPDSLAALLNFALLTGIPAKGTIIPVVPQANAAGCVAVLDGGMVSPEDLLKRTDVNALFIYEDDPFHYLNGSVIKEALSSKEFVLVADAMASLAGDLAHVIVPTGTFAEKQGTFVAQDGYLRTLGKAMGTGAAGFRFLSELLSQLGGKRFRDAAEVTEQLRREGFIESLDGGRQGLPGSGARVHFNTHEAGKPPAFTRTHQLMLRDVFSNHHLFDKDVYSKGVGAVYSAPGYPISEDKLFMSPEDAASLGVAERDSVIIQSEAGSIKKAVSIKTGLRPGVLEYVLFKERRDALNLSKSMKKVIDVSVQKG